MAITDKFTKQPEDVQDYDIDFADYLASMDNDTLLDPPSYVVEADEGITIDSHEQTGSIIKVWVSGGTHGANYKVTARATTTGGRTKEHDILVRVREQ